MSLRASMTSRTLLAASCLLASGHAVAADGKSAPVTAAAGSPTADATKAPQAKPVEESKAQNGQGAAPSGEEAKKAEAAHRFDRALKLFEAGDNAGALAEFKRTYEIFPDPMVLYNMGLVYAAMGRPVDAVDALEPLVRQGGLAPAHLERAKQTLADQQARIGRLLVTTRPAEARIEVDGVEVATTPRALAIRISEGKHIIGAVAEGFAPARKELFIAGNADASLQLELVPTQGKQLANLTLKTQLAGVEVKVDGAPVGHTPLPTSLSVAAGSHVVELSRAGYVSARRTVEVGPGAIGEISADLQVDPASLGVDGATLVLEPSESPAELSVDGVRRGIYTEPLRLPRGPHHLVVAAPGFIPSERDVNLEGSVSNLVTVVLDPTQEKRERYQSNARFHRTWGWIGIVGGAVVAGGGAALAVVASSQKKDAQGELNAINSKYDNNVAPCDFRDAFAAEDSQPVGQQGSYLCDKAISGAKSKLDSAKLRGTIGFVGVGVGGAIAVTGLVLLLTGNDPNKYERTTKTAALRAHRPQWSIVPGPGEFGTGLRLVF